MISTDDVSAGTGFDADDPVEVLTTAPMMDQLKGPDGRWRIVPAHVDFSAVLEQFGSSTPTTMVVIDTGVCDDHPTLRGRVVEQVDLTGEGVRDENGHGTAVAAELIATSLPGTKIISVKALDRNGKASVARLSHAIRIADSFPSEGRLLVNLSAGRRNPTCNGDCPLCTSVKHLDKAGVLTIAAAGNTPGITYCPARSAISVATPDSWSAPGDIVLSPRDWVEVA